MTFIYALCEPGTRTVRYIGKANHPQRRLQGHLSVSIKERNHLGNWLRSLQGVKPALVILHEVPSADWERAEECFIRLAKGCKMNLVNSTDGGAGSPNPCVETQAKFSAKRPAQTPESRAKKSAALMGVPKSPEHRANISAGKKGKPRSRCPLSLEARVNLSASKSGEKNPMFGRVLTSETLAKRSAGLKRAHALKKALNQPWKTLTEKELQ